MTQPLKRHVCAVVSVGPGNGEAPARRFASAAHAVALLARRRMLVKRAASEIPGTLALECDVGDEVAMVEPPALMATQMGPQSTPQHSRKMGRMAWRVIPAMSAGARQAIP